MSLLSGPVSLVAQSGTVNIVTTAVPFLRITPDPRAGGMGDVGIATSPDANSAFWNLGKIPFAKSHNTVALSYTPWFKDLGFNDVFLGGVSWQHKVDSSESISSTLRYFNLGNIQFTDFSGNNLNSFHPTEFAFSFGYSKKLSPRLALGVSLSYINSNLVTGSVNGINYKAGNAVAGNVSVFHDGTDFRGQGLNWGITLSNLGSKIGYTNDAAGKDFIPANLGAGIAYIKVFDINDKMSFGLDINKLLVPRVPTDSAGLANYRSNSVTSAWFKSFSDEAFMRTLEFSFGMEYTYTDYGAKDEFTLSTGYFYEDPDQGGRQYYSVGVGFRYKTNHINFSYLVPGGSSILRNPLSNTMRFGLSFDLR